MAQIPAGADRSRQLSRKQTGDAFEQQARRWLERKGLRFIAAGVRVRGGEIDLIMLDGAVTVFVEGPLPGLSALRRRVRQRDPQKAAEVITRRPPVARPPQWEF